MNKIIKTCQFVVNNAQHVVINNDKINNFCDSFNYFIINHWINESPFNINKLNIKDRLHFLLVFNAISFSYWGKPKWRIKYHLKEFDGAYGLISAIARAIENKIPILNAKFLSMIKPKELDNILKGNVKIPLFNERLSILREIGSILINDFDGDFRRLLEEANYDALKLLNLIVHHFPSFNDFSIYNSKKVYFFKRAQLLISDIAQSFNELTLSNISELTACADYKLPFILRRLGILSYSAYLSNKIDNQIQIKKDSAEEVELRASTIIAVDLITKRLKKKIKDINSIYVNDYIWLLSQKKLINDKPYHLTRTTTY